MDALYLTARALAEALGGKREGGGYMCPCPAHDDSKPSLSVKEGAKGRPIFRCHAGCKQEDVLAALRARGLWPEWAERVPKNKAVPLNVKWARGLWNAGHDINSSRPHPYFLARGIDTTQFQFLNYTLRLHPEDRHKASATVGPSVVAIVTDNANVQWAVQRTFLTADEARKRGVDPARQSLGTIKGHAIRIGSPRTPTVMISEGLEDAMTARAAMEFKLVAWAAAGVGNAKTIDLPEDVKEVILLADNDPAGARGVTEAATRFKAAGKRVLVARPPEGVKDFNALVAGKDGAERAAGYATVRGCIEAAAEPGPAEKEADADDWPEVDRYAKPKQTYSNAIVALERFGFQFTRDTFRCRSMVAARSFGEGKKLTDVAVRQLRKLIFDEFGFDPGKDATWEAALYLAEQNPVHPVCEYLDRLRWDGKPRLDRWLFDCLKMQETPFLVSVSRLTLIAAVRRVRQPGVKFDHCFVVEGPQRAGKSTVLRELGKGYKSEGGYFSDTPVIHAPFERQVERTTGVWILELGELNGLKRADNNAVKNFLSSGEAAGVRAAYERVSDDYPRQFIPIGTTNDKNYLADQTGNTRYWPGVAGATGKIDIGWMRENVDQLWSEAAHYEAAGESIELDPSLYDAAAKEQEARRETDPWELILKELETSQWVVKHKGFYRVKTADLIAQVLKIPSDRQTRQHENRIGEVMRVLGWTGPKNVRFGPEDVKRGYVKPTGEELPGLEPEP